MASQRTDRVGRLFGISAIAVAVLVAGEIAAKEKSPGEDRIEAELAAGEFSAVRQHAERTNDPAARDTILGQLAFAQASTGSPRGFAESVRAISDPSARQRVVGAISASSGGDLAGGAAADFDSLIQLIQSTVSPMSWDAVGGPGSIAPFPTGVYVDTQGTLRKVRSANRASAGLEDLLDRGRAAPDSVTAGGATARSARQESELRYISLPRLERELELLRLTGQPIDDSLRVLAGLRRVQYVFVYPDTGDLVLAGPAGNWREQDGRVVSVATGAPVVRLEDLVVLMRRARQSQGEVFGCAITPRQENLAQTQEYLKATTARPLRPGERDRWIDGIRNALGQQVISVFGLDPRTRVARVLVEADYHMKLIGMGLEEGVPGLESYLESVPLGPKHPSHPMSVLRWWFTLNYDAITATRDRLAFELRGPGVRVLSENELLTEQGERIHTGTSDELNARFARDFTRHFDLLAEKYPVYAELRNVFDLALVAALFEEQGLYERANWQAAAMLDPGRLPVASLPPPREVESVINHRVAGGKYIVVGVSGGVSVDPSELVAAASLETDDYGAVRQNHRPLPGGFGGASWWWDTP